MIFCSISITVFFAISMKIFDVKIDSFSKDEVYNRIHHALEPNNAQACTIVTPNAEILLKARSHTRLQAALNDAKISIPDSISLYMAYHLLDSKLPHIIQRILLPWYYLRLCIWRQKLYKKYGERLCGSDLTEYVLNYLQTQWKSCNICILDMLVTDPKTPWDYEKILHQQRVCELLSIRYPALRFSLILHEDNWQKELAKKQPDVLLSTLGSPQQEYSIHTACGACPTLRLAMAIGWSVDFLTGFQKRAPRIMRHMGLEWLFRLLQNPKRRTRRIYNAVVQFPLTVLRDKHAHRKQSKN